MNLLIPIESGVIIILNLFWWNFWWVFPPKMFLLLVSYIAISKCALTRLMEIQLQFSLKPYCLIVTTYEALHRYIGICVYSRLHANPPFSSYCTPVRYTTSVILLSQQTLAQYLPPWIYQCFHVFYFYRCFWYFVIGHLKDTQLRRWAVFQHELRQM